MVAISRPTVKGACQSSSPRHTPAAGEVILKGLELPDLGRDGSDIRTSCPHCQSPNMGRVGVDSGDFQCKATACQHALNAADLCKVVLNLNFRACF